MLTPTGSKNVAGEPCKIHAALNVQTAISFPSERCIQWTPEGQMLFITKLAVYVMTPDHGVNFDNESAVKAPADEAAKDDPQTMGWFRTIVQDANISEGTRWPERSQEWGTVSLGSIDTSVSSVVSSPTGVSGDGRVVLAVLTSNMDLSLWKAGKNYLKGEWTKITDVTPTLISHYSNIPAVAATLQAQTTYISWTPRANYNIAPAPHIDSSLLVLGNRAGTLTFLRFRAPDSVEILASLKVADHWVTRIDVSPWWLATPDVCEAFVAFAASNGNVGLAKISQKLTATNGFVPQYTLELAVQNVSDPVLDFDRAGVTALRWVDIPQRPPVLVICKPGIVYLWSIDTGSPAHWSGLLSFELNTQPTSTAASAFHPASGILYIQRHDCLLVALYDGSIHTIHRLSSAPTLVDLPPSGTEGAVVDVLCSAGLSKAARTVFARVEQGTVDRKTMNQFNGVASYDGGATFLWAQESAVPSDFSYKHDAKHNNTVVVTKLWTEAATALLEDLERAINQFDCTSPVIPLHLLRPTFLQLQNPAAFETNFVKVLELISTPVADRSVDVVVGKVPVDGDEDYVSAQFRLSLQSNLFGWSEMVALRMRLSVADFTWKYSQTDERRAQCGGVAQTILYTIAHRNLRVLIRHVAAAVPILSTHDAPFILRLILQSSLPGTPPDLVEEGRILTSLTDHLIPKDAEGVILKAELDERCPACGAGVPLHDTTSAMCPNGHQWRRCSVTTFILSTPWVRTCVGCSRKAFLPPSIVSERTKGSGGGGGQLPVEVAKGWVGRELLEAVHQCLYCNNSFVSLL